MAIKVLYRTRVYIWDTTIERVERDEAYLPTIPLRELAGVFHESWEAAHAYLLARATKQVAKATTDLCAARDLLCRTKELTKPED